MTPFVTRSSDQGADIAGLPLKQERLLACTDRAALMPAISPCAAASS